MAMYRNKVDSKFARSQMEKHGWTEGTGLGKEGQGMTDIIKVKLRSTRTGVGTDLGKQFRVSWWEDVYNKSVNNLKVENGKDGAKVTVVETDLKKKKADKMELLYGRFRKGATLTNSVEVKHDDGNDDDSSDEERPGKYLTFDEMFKACEGRVCHRGARHGLDLTAKLRRIEEQDKILLARQSKLNNSQEDDAPQHPLPTPPSPPAESGAAPEEEKKKKRKKRKKERQEEAATERAPAEVCEGSESKGENSTCDPAAAAAGDAVDMAAVDNDEGSDSERKKKKKRKKEKKERRERENEEAAGSDVAASTNETRSNGPIAEDSEEMSEKRRKKKEKREKKRKEQSENFDENCPDCVEDDIEVPCSDQKLSKKKQEAGNKRRKETDNLEEDEKPAKKAKKERRKKDPSTLA